MGKNKRNGTVISPIQKDSGKNRRTLDSNTKMDNERIAEEITKVERRIHDITMMDNPQTKDLIQMIALTSERDALRYRFQLIPEIVSSILDARLTTEMAAGGSLREAVIHEVIEETASTVRRVDQIHSEVQELVKKQESAAGLPKKWDYVIRNERIRCIKDSRKGLIVFDKKILSGETGSVDDEKLRELVEEIVGEEEVEEWRRMAGRTALSKWSRPKPPTISIRLRSADARERIIRRARTQKKHVVRREIPALLMDEFKELSKAAAKIREEENCQTYVGVGGAEVFLRRRKDESEHWKTVKRL